MAKQPLEKLLIRLICLEPFQKNVFLFSDDFAYDENCFLH